MSRNHAAPDARERMLLRIRRRGPKGLGRGWLVNEFYKHGPDSLLSGLIASGLVEVRREPGEYQAHGATVYVAREVAP